MYPWFNRFYMNQLRQGTQNKKTTHGNGLLCSVNQVSSQFLHCRWCCHCESCKVSLLFHFNMLNMTHSLLEYWYWNVVNDSYSILFLKKKPSDFWVWDVVLLYPQYQMPRNGPISLHNTVPKFPARKKDSKLYIPKGRLNGDNNNDNSQD